MEIYLSEITYSPAFRKHFFANFQSFSNAITIMILTLYRLHRLLNHRLINYES